MQLQFDFLAVRCLDQVALHRSSAAHGNAHEFDLYLRNFLQKHLNPIRGIFCGRFGRILGVCPAVSLTFGP